MNIKTINDNLHNLKSEDYLEIQRLLKNLPDDYLNLNSLYKLMDQVWDEMGCDNKNLDQHKLSTFYKHPVWLLNGLFIEQDEESLSHRNSISDWIAQNSVTHILDFGGGFGTLARMIAQKNEKAIIDIYEPYPNNLAISKCSAYSSINFVDNLDRKYDCLVSTDVLEHVPDPLDLFDKMIQCVNINGYLLIGNCFKPVIKCHLPSTFHFLKTFNQFAEAMGLSKIGVCQGSHVIIYQKIDDTITNWKKIRKMEYLSQRKFAIEQFKAKTKSRIKRLLTNPQDVFTIVKQKLISK